MPILGDNLTAFIVLIVWVVVMNSIAYSAKYFIRRQGLEANMFSKHFRDMKSLLIISKDPYPEDTKRSAKFYFWTLTVGVMIVIIPIMGLLVFAIIR